MSTLFVSTADERSELEARVAEGGTGVHQWYPGRYSICMGWLGGDNLLENFATLEKKSSKAIEPDSTEKERRKRKKRRRM